MTQLALPSTKRSLQIAVHQRSGLSLMALNQRLFSYWFHSFIYNQIWEDPVVDLKALDLQSDSEVLTISSAGCNVLNYLTAHPRRIVAVDLNPYHMALTRLKIEAMRHLPNHAAFYNFFGYGDCPNNPVAYTEYLADKINPQLHTFWTNPSITGYRFLNLFQKGLYRSTRLGQFIRVLHHLGGIRTDNLLGFLQSTNLDQQHKFFRDHVEVLFAKDLIRFLAKLPVSFFSLGIPPQQFDSIRKEGDLVEQFRHRIKRLICDFPIQDNYFAWQAISCQYDHGLRQAVPPYLKLAHYNDIKGQLNKIETHQCSIIDYLKRQKSESLDRFAFLDSQDWMNQATLNELWTELTRVGRPDSIIIFRTAGSKSIMEQQVEPKILQQFAYEKDRSLQLFHQDRSAIYGGFHVYRKKQ